MSGEWLHPSPSAGSTLITELGQLLLPQGDGVVVITVAAPGDATGTAVVRAILASVHEA